MVILTAPFGQTSNRFLQHVHIDSFCRNNGINFYNKFLSWMHKDYPNLKVQADNKLINCFMKNISRLKLESFGFNDELENDYYKSLILKSQILFCDGFYFRSYENTTKYRSLYQKLFNPSIDKAYLNSIWLKKVNVDQKIVGVHVRRGDYDLYREGVFYFNDSVYIEKMQQMASNLNYNCRFIIFSNDDKLNISNYNSSFKDVGISKNTVPTDHYLLSKCDYIIGPPSTFTLWASYMGETLYYHILSDNDSMDLNKFKVCNG